MSAHGDDARLVARALGIDPSSILDLSVTLNPFAPDPAPLVERAIRSGALRRYPDDGDRERARDALACALGVAPWRVLVTNGGAEAIALVAGVIGEGWVDDPDFSLYARHLSALVRGAPRFRSDPHNPTGLLAPPSASAAVWDEAFYPLATGRWTCAPGPEPRAAPAVVVGSLTKVFGCPGLRLGYAVVPEDDGASLGCAGLAARLGAAQARWSVGTPALVVVPDLLESADLGSWCAAIARHRRELCDLLRRHGLSPRPSDANFVLVDGAADLKARLAPLGVVVRDCTSFGLPDAVRIAVPDGDGLQRLDRALA